MRDRAVEWVVFHLNLLRLPPRVARFYRRARRLARSTGDTGTLVGAASPRQAAEILRRAAPHDEVVEIGTGAGWTSIALALNNHAARVTTYDVVPHEVVARYLALAPEAAARIRSVHGPGEEPQPDPTRVGFLFIDGNHEHDSTVAAFEAWRDRLVPDGVVVFHDFDPTWPGVQSAVEALGLRGTVTAGMFVWRAVDAAGR